MCGIVKYKERRLGGPGTLLSEVRRKLATEASPFAMGYIRQTTKCWLEALIGPYIIGGDLT